jgi:serine/threonine protein kinase
MSSTSTSGHRRLTDSTDNYPIAEEPTREFSMEDDSDAFVYAPKEGRASIPKRIGDYKIIELIGSGGMGQVYLAEHTRMQRVVAIKMLPVERMRDPVAIERFYEEVRAASRLLHPNIVTAFDAGESDGIHYLAMEYVDGQTLTKLVSRDGPMSVGAAASAIRQAALGLLHAHRAGIIHRDVKPGNLMRAIDGTVKVLDLGLARISSASLLTEDRVSQPEHPELKEGSVSSKGRLVGTLPFMSPEQLDDPDSADARSDIYSLGATLYFLLAGRTPYSGEYLDLVYGHRHGEIPDLMQVRDDVDLQLANVFKRMMAKSPKERYASLDEVIDDLSGYASKTDSPLWLAEFSQRPTGTEQSTISGGSTTGSTTRVFAIDFGMFYSATAESTPEGGVKPLPAGEENNPLFRMALAGDDDGKLVFGVRALDRRGTHPHRLVHCLPMYIGKPLVDREIAGRQCPPEVLLAMLFQKIKENAWPGKSMPQATAITVPSSYDQLHRQSVLLSARMAGLHSVRLVDRGLAAVQSLFLEPDLESIEANEAELERDQEQTILFVGLTGQASEVDVIRRESVRLHQLASAGHWHSGTLPWLHRLVGLTAKAFIEKHDFDPRLSIKHAARLQMACEKALNSMLLMEKVQITLEVKHEEKTVTILRNRWLKACEDLIVGLRRTTLDACKRAGVSMSNVRFCVTLGPLMRIGQVRDAVLKGLHPQAAFHPVDRSDVARGAAACLAAELPGRTGLTMPPRSVSGQSLGIVVEDAKKRRRILPIIPKGTSLPARTNRRLTVVKERDSMTLSLVESSGVANEDWHSLGRYDFQLGDSRVRSRMIGFEVNVNGLLQVRAQLPGKPGSTRLPSLPEPVLSEEAIAEWIDWLASLR